MYISYKYNKSSKTLQYWLTRDILYNFYNTQFYYNIKIYRRKVVRGTFDQFLSLC